MPGNGGRRVVGVQRREDQVAGERRLDRHLGGLQVADLAHHDDVGILAHQRTQAGGEGRGRSTACTWVWLNAGSIISIGSSIVQTFTLLGGELLQRRIERGRLARAGGAGDQDDAVAHCPISVCQRSASVAEKASASNGLSTVPGSKIRITTFSPKAVGIVDSRISTSAPGKPPAPSGRFGS